MASVPESSQANVEVRTNLPLDHRFVPFVLFKVFCQTPKDEQRRVTGADLQDALRSCASNEAIDERAHELHAHAPIPVDDLNGLAEFGSEHGYLPLSNPVVSSNRQSGRFSESMILGRPTVIPPISPVKRPG